MKQLRQRFRAWRGLQHPRHVTVDGNRLHIPVGVLDPVLFRSGKIFAEYLSHQVEPGDTLLDVGCGSGVVGVLAQHVGALVTATDIDQRACEAARKTGIAHVLHGHLFEPLAGKRFDHVAFNPPYFRGVPSDHPLGLALYGGNELQIVRAFIEQVPTYLKANGNAWIILSDSEPLATEILTDQWSPVHQTVIQGERLQIYRLQPNA